MCVCALVLYSRIVGEKVGPGVVVRILNICASTTTETPSMQAVEPEYVF